MAPGLVSLWSDWERRLAVAAGAIVAFVSLLQHCPVWVACARGAVALVVVALLARGIARVLAWSAAGDRIEAAAKAKAGLESGCVEPVRATTQGEHRG
jgi:hypothetical protein